MKKNDGPRSYVETLRDQTEQYGQHLLRENEKLRSLALAVETENARLQHEVAAARSAIADVRTLREQIDTLLHEKAQLQLRVEDMAGEVAGLRTDRMAIAEQLASVEREGRGFAEQYATAMRQNASLANLYVASYMLHSSVDREEVLDGIGQIVVNIIGSEDYAILERTGDALRVAKSAGESAAALRDLAGTFGTLAEEARLRVFAPGAGEGGLTAFVPLVIGDDLTGAIAIFRLLPQKPVLVEGDSEIFEMLSAHAATALYCAALHARRGSEVPACAAAPCE